MQNWNIRLFAIHSKIFGNIIKQDLIILKNNKIILKNTQIYFEKWFYYLQKWYLFKTTGSKILNIFGIFLKIF